MENENQKILGQNYKGWATIYKLYVHEKEKEPKDLWDLKEFWDFCPRTTPNDCVGLYIKISSSKNIDVKKLDKMIKALDISRHLYSEE